MSTTGSRERAASGVGFPPPQAVEGLALRQEVLDLLSAPDLRLGIITAPAGYGKTSHAIAWVAADARPTAWLDVLDRHNDARILLADLVAALMSVTDVRDGGLAADGATADQYATGVATSFGRAVRGCSDPFVLVLDDVHRIDDLAAGALIESLAANVPTGSTVLLVGRANRIRPTVLLQVGPAFSEVTTTDLALGPADVSHVLSTLGVSASSDDVARVTSDTEGWPVGVRLAGLARLAAVRRDTTSSSTGRESAVYEYIESEWLWGLSDDERDFLLRVSLLDFLTVPLCNHVLGRDDSGALLHRFFADRLLVIPLDRREDEYRMHGLLREALQAAMERSSAATARAIHGRASAWFEEAGDIERAVQHAMAAEDLDRAERLVTQHSPLAYASGRFTTISRWVGSFPRDRVLHSPSLCLCAALAALGSGDGESLAVWLRLGEQAAADSPEVEPSARLGLLNLRATSNTGPVGPAIAAATEAYQGLPPGIWHAGACLALGIWRWTAGDDLAQRVVDEGVAEATVLGAPAVAANCTAVLAMMAHESGDSARMRTLAADARSMLADAGLERAPAMVLVTAMNALAAASSGQPQSACADWNLARSQLAHFKDVFGWANVQVRVALVHTSLLLGDRIGAQTLLREVQDFLVRQPDAVRAHRQVASLAERLRYLQRHATVGASSITTAELRVLHYLPTNLSQAEISERLFVSRYTVKTHCASIYRKLGVTSRSDAVVAAGRAGLLEPTVAIDVE